MYERVVGVLGDFVDSSVIKEDSALVDDLGLSSLDVINIVTAFEDEFGIEVPDRVIIRIFRRAETSGARRE